MLPSLTAGCKRSAAIIAVAAASLGFTGCIDDKYDLSDVDTNVRLKVEDLTLPINIDEIKLNSIISEPKPGDILQIVDGEYTLVRKGSFASSALKVNSITIAAPHVNPAVATFKPSLPAGASMKALPDEVAFNVTDNISAAINYKNDDVPTEIVKIASLGINWKVDFNVKIEAVGNATSRFFLRDFYFQLPKDLEATSTVGEYYPSTGLLKIDYLEVNNNVFNFSLNVTGITASDPQVKLFYDENGKHTILLDTEVGIESGEIGLKLADVSLSGIPSELKVTTNLWLSAIDVKTFSGEIKYDVDKFNIAPVDLNDLPDVLSQQGTDIKLTNPQIYLRIENPFSMYNLRAETAFKLIANRPEGSKTSSIDAGTFTIFGNPVSTYCLSPNVPAHYYVDPDPQEAEIYDFSSAHHVPFSALSTALAGDGLPKTIDIDLDPTTVPAQPVTDFTLGRYNPVKGNYLFFSPLSLGQNSLIEYTSTEDGWADDDLNKLTISKLKVNMIVDNDLPFDIALTGTPLNIDGPIPGTSITPVTIRGGETQEVTLEVNGTITRLDGIEFSAKAVSDKNAASLSPDQYIKLTNIRVTVSGYYDDEL